MIDGLIPQDFDACASCKGVPAEAGEMAQRLSTLGEN